nr:hypothetical protein CKG001_26820 [Bdellovibrio sp. CKG001]BFD63990.1 hypothetical protein BdHM001_26710 [Bdellovibrio sp. HM001]
MKLEDIILAHAKYKLSLRNFVEKGSELEIPEGDLLFWLQEQARELSHLRSFRILQREHEAFVNYVSAVLTLVAEGQRAQAQELMSSEMFVLISEEIVTTVSLLERELNRKTH